MVLVEITTCAQLAALYTYSEPEPLSDLPVVSRLLLALCLF